MVQKLTHYNLSNNQMCYLDSWKWQNLEMHKLYKLSENKKTKKNMKQKRQKNQNFYNNV